MNRRLRNALQAHWERSGPPGIRGRLVSGVLAPAAWVYAALQTVRRWLYRWGWIRSRKLCPAVVSIGGLRVGGSGKTPFTRWLAGGLRDQGYRVAVLTRGYGRSGSGEGLVLYGADRHRWDPDRYGDEPCMLSASLGDVPVGVDADRYRGGLNVMRFFPVDVFLLDDGFQHLGLVRECDIVLLPEGDDPARTACVPRGPAREPASALRDADILVRVGTGAGPGPVALAGSIERYAEAAVVFDAAMVPGDLRVLGGDAKVDPASLQGERILAFSGIARPRAFRSSLEETGLKVEEVVTYPDHHRYTARDHRELVERLAGFDRAVTTEKDAVKLARFPWPMGKVLVLGVRPVLGREDDFWKVLQERLSGDGRAFRRQADPQRSA